MSVCSVCFLRGASARSRSSKFAEPHEHRRANLRSLTPCAWNTLRCALLPFLTSDAVSALSLSLSLSLSTAGGGSLHCLGMTCLKPEVRHAKSHFAQSGIIGSPLGDQLSLTCNRSGHATRSVVRTTGTAGVQGARDKARKAHQQRHDAEGRSSWRRCPPTVRA